MAKQSDKPKASPFDALRIARIGEPVLAEEPAAVAGPAGTAVQMVKQPDRQLAKSLDPDYVKFTTYVRKKTHLAVKGHLVAQERELSELVEELLTSWLSKQRDG